jgi:glycosyltransferase involved in cell wall biosynthesis
MSSFIHPPLALLLVDALRHDYVTPHTAPFLYRLMQEGASGPLIPTYGFQEHPGFLTGCLPDQTVIGHTMYVRAPDASPFREIDIPNVKHLERHPDLVRVLRPLWDRKTRYIENVRGHSASACYGMTSRIPPALLQQFAFGWEQDSQESGALGVQSVYDLLRQAGKSWLALGHPRDDQRTENLLAQFDAAVHPDHALVYIHFGELDWLGHEYGPGSRQVLAALRGIDHAVERVVNRLREMHGNVATLVFGDHGMVGVERTVDVEAALAQTGLAVPDDYVYFLDSTGIRLWPGHDRAETMLCEALDGIDGIHRIQESERKELGLKYADSRPYGEVLYAAEKGVLVCPNFFQTDSINGMHGYLPDVTDNWSRYIAHTIDWMPGHATLTMQDLFPIIVRALGLTGHMEQTTENDSDREAGTVNAPDGRLPLPRAALAPSTNEQSALAPETAPKVSLIIPTYNRAHLLPRLVEGIERQSHPPDEVIFVDDGSTDDTPAVLGEICGNHDGWRSIQQDNAGPGAARNLGVGAASGELLVFVDDDCVPHTRFVEEHIRTHLGKGKGLAVAGYTPWHPDLEISPFMEMALRGVLFAFNRITDPENMPFTCFYTANCSAWRDDVNAVERFDESLRFYEDADFAYRLQQRGVRLVFNERAVAYHAEPIDLEKFLTRQRAAGKSAVRFLGKHPHLADEIGVTEIANPQLREQYYVTLLRHAFIQGVEDALREADGEYASQALEAGQFEDWMHGWVSDLVERHQELEGRLRSLEDTVMQKDQYIRELVQSKDETINGLEATLQRYHATLPFRVYFWLKQQMGS